MDAEGSHSGDGNGCGDGERWWRGKGIVGERKRCPGKGWWASGASSVPEVRDCG